VTIDPGAPSPSRFDTFAATARTLRTFIASYGGIKRQVTGALLPDPDRAG
jgi:hypothetical protein